MNYGKFFSLDQETSDLIKGQSIYNYRPVRMDNNPSASECGRETPRYPIFCSIQHDGVFFYCHRCSEGGEGKLTHECSPILELRISGETMSKSSLTETLRDIYDTAYPLISENETENTVGHAEGEKHQNESAFLDAVNRAYRTKRAEKGQENEQGKYESDDIPSNEVYYSSLEVCKIKYEEGSIKNSCKQKPKEDFIRKLFLDFLFDLEHTELFYNSIYFERVYKKLHENFLFDAIVKKIEYYYQRKVCNKALTDMALTDDRELPIGDFIWRMDEYVKAERCWVDTICNSCSYEVFTSAHWFDGVESELGKIYRSKTESGGSQDDYSCVDMLRYVKKKVVKRLRKKRPKKDDLQDNESVKQCEQCGRSKESCRKLKNHCEELKNHRKKLKEQRKTLNEKADNIDETLRRTAKMSCHCMMKGSDIMGCWRLRYGIHPAWKLLPIILLVVVILCHAFGVKICLTSAAEHCKMIAMLYNCNFVNMLLDEFSVVIVGFLLSALAWVVIFGFSIRRINWWSICCVDLPMPRVIAALFSAWLPIACGAGTYGLLSNQSFYNGFAFVFCIVLLLAICVFLCHSMYKINPFEKPWRHIKKSLLIMFITFIYSYAIGICELVIFGQSQKIMVPGTEEVYAPSDIVSMILGDYTPRIVMLSILCMFVGIFIQMLAANRSVLE